MIKADQNEKSDPQRRFQLLKSSERPISKFSYHYGNKNKTEKNNKSNTPSEKNLYLSQALQIFIQINCSKSWAIPFWSYQYNIGHNK